VQLEQRFPAPRAGVGLKEVEVEGAGLESTATNGWNTVERGGTDWLVQPSTISLLRFTLTCLAVESLRHPLEAIGRAQTPVRRRRQRQRQMAAKPRRQCSSDQS